MSSLSLPTGASLNTSNALAADTKSLNALKYAAGENNPQATREAAKQLESLFMREMIKSMREATATLKSGLLDSDQSKMATDMLDQQLSVSMSGLPGGLTQAITRQLTRSMGGAADATEGEDDGTLSFSIPSTLSLAGKARRSASSLQGNAAVGAYAPAPKGRDNFVQHHSTAAQKVAQDSGIPASFMLGQAGHETGWGKSEIRNADGSNSFNLFGIKAGKGWTGKVAEITTTEYIDGQARKVTAKFRAYDSYEESFRDYARLISESPRYAQAMQSTGSAQAYASALQKAGYATDPEYANKLSRAIQSTQLAQRNQA